MLKSVTTDPLEIPVFANVPLYNQRVTLDGVEYLLKLDWTDREQRFYLSIFLTDGTPISTGNKLVANWPLLRKCANVNKPPGILIAVDCSPNGGDPPVLSDIGIRVKILYFPVTQ